MTRERGHPSAMIRFVADPEGVLTPDPAAKLPGRGAWITARREVLEKGLAKGQIARAAEARSTPEGLAEKLVSLMLKRVQDTLSIGRRTGRVIGGGGKIRAFGSVAGLIIAADASARESRALIGDVDHDWVVQSLSGDELGAAFGRASIAFAAVAAGDPRLEDRIRTEIERLDGLRPA
ncbi:MAG: DUF448 domain-containing protein [Candidatus Puniceispirillales bacterium]